MKFTSKVIHGKKHGSSIGYPTANLEVTDEIRQCLDKEGVYAVKVLVCGQGYKGALFWGKRTLFNEPDTICEVLLSDFFEGDLYGQMIEVEVVDFVRQSQVIKDNEQLKKLIEEDIERVESILQS